MPQNIPEFFPVGGNASESDNLLLRSSYVKGKLVQAQFWGSSLKTV